MVRKEITLLRSVVGHKRIWPKKNAFNYKVFYVKVPISSNNFIRTPKFLSYNSWNIFSLYTKDHGAKNHETSWYSYITGELKEAGISHSNDDAITLITHPRIFGYAFNPISFWTVVDKNQNLKAVMCEVTSTFKQTHNYLLAKPGGASILPDDIMLADKKLYVSPFNKNEGYYEFSFTCQKNKFKAVINYFDKEGRHILNTYMGGVSSNLTDRSIISSVASYPAMTLVIVARIHWQAVKLYFKRVKHTMKTRPLKYVNGKTTVSKRQK